MAYETRRFNAAFTRALQLIIEIIKTTIIIITVKLIW